MQKHYDGLSTVFWAIIHILRSSDSQTYGYLQSLSVWGADSHRIRHLEGDSTLGPVNRSELEVRAFTDWWRVTRLVPTVDTCHFLNACIGCLTYSFPTLLHFGCSFLCLISYTVHILCSSYCYILKPILGWGQHFLSLCVFWIVMLH